MNSAAHALNPLLDIFLFMGSDRLSRARDAFREKNLEAMKEAHSHEAFDSEQHRENIGDYVAEMVYGALDGAVTTFAIVAGAAGAGLGTGVILVLGFANLLADGLSMAAGTYLSMSSRQSLYNAERRREEWEVENFPEGEREEVKRIYQSKGFAGKGLEAIVELITSKKTVWVDTMMAEEIGLAPEKKGPVKAAALTYIAFIAAGFVPLVVFIVSYFYPMERSLAFPVSIAMTFATIFTAGSLRSLVIAKSWFEAGIEMLIIGGLTAIVSYGIGAFLGSLVL